jgi:acetyltransferase-like isoleucine patch superfamily enzyme/acyl carrier protein
VIGRMFVQAAAGALEGTRSALALRAATRRGARVRVFGWLQVICEGELVVGNGVVFVSSPSPIAIVVPRGGYLTIGDGALLESGVTVRANTRVTIGSRARIGAGSVVDDEAIEPGEESGETSGEIKIGDDAWIEDGVLILSGATVGAAQIVPRGAIVGTRYEEANPPTMRSPPSRAPEANVAVRATHGRIRKVIARVVSAAEGVEPSANLRQLRGWDSLAALRVLVALEKEFAVVLPHDLFSEETTMDRLLPFLAPGA